MAFTERASTEGSLRGWRRPCYGLGMSRFRQLIDPAVLTLILSLVVGSLWLGTHQHDSDFGAGFVLGLIAGGSLAFMALGSRRRG